MDILYGYEKKASYYVRVRLGVCVRKGNICMYGLGFVRGVVFAFGFEVLFL